MAAAKMTSLRLDEELLEWATGYAKERGVSRTSVVESALRSFRDDARRSVPELGGSGSRPGPVRLNTVSQAAEWAKARQVRLNSAKDRASG